MSRNLAIDWFWPVEMTKLNIESRDARMREAQDPNTPVSDLILLSNDNEPGIRWAISENPSTPPEIKAYLKALEIAYDVMES